MFNIITNKQGYYFNTNIIEGEKKNNYSMDKGEGSEIQFAAFGI